MAATLMRVCVATRLGVFGARWAAALLLSAASLAGHAQTSSLPSGYTPNWVATPGGASAVAPLRRSLLTTQQELLKAYPDTSLTACPAGWKVKYFFYYQDIPERRASSWCGAAQADVDWANATDPNRWRIPYLVDSCTPGVSWFYSHAFPDGTRYHSPAYRDITMLCIQGELKVSVAGPTQALPLDMGGQPLQLVATVTQDGAPAEGVSLSLQSSSLAAGGSAAMVYSTTNAAGHVVINYYPPQTLLGANKADRFVFGCGNCTNSASVSIQVQGTPLTDSNQTCDAGMSTPNPILPATGTKVKVQTDWLDWAPHPLTLTRNYASRWTAPPGAAMGNEWSHSFAARIAGAGSSARTRTVLFADGQVSAFVNLAPTASIDPNSGGAWSCEPNVPCEPPLVFEPNPAPPASRWSTTVLPAASPASTCRSRPRIPCGPSPWCLS